MKIGFRGKVLLAITLVAVVTSLVIGFAFFWRAESIVQDQYIKSVLGTMSVSVGTFEEQMQQAYSMAVALEQDEALLQKIEQYQASGRDVHKAMQISSYLQEAFPGQPLVDMVYVYLPVTKQVITSAEHNPVREVFYPDQHNWLTAWPKERTSSLSPELVLDNIRRSPHYTLAFVRPVRREGGGAPLAVVSVGINERKLFYQCLSVMGMDSSNTYYLLDKNANVASTAAAKYIGRDFSDIVNLSADMPQSGESAVIHDDLLITSVVSPLTRYRMLGVASRSEMVAQLRAQRLFILTMLACTLLLMLIPAFFVSRRVYRPIEKLQEAMQKISSGDLSARAEVVSHDEISQLSRGFNTMVDQIESLIHDVINEQSQKNQAELEALQYQITPHFMYNTLNSIKYAAHLQQAHSIAEQLGAFIELLQASINRKGPFVTAGEEIRMVENYVKLQQFRYMNQISVSFSVHPDTEGLLVPNLILQPLVENAILHGQREGGAGIRIAIQAACRDGRLELSVEDNGQGMTQQQVQGLLANPKKPKEGFSSIGISNIMDRLRLYYGQEGTLTIESRVGTGTRAVIRIPAASRPPEGDGGTQ